MIVTVTDGEQELHHAERQRLCHGYEFWIRRNACQIRQIHGPQNERQRSRFQCRIQNGFIHKGMNWSSPIISQIYFDGLKNLLNLITLNGASI